MRLLTRLLSRSFVLAIALIASCAGNLNASWRLFDPSKVTAFEPFSAQRGLVAFGNPAPILQVFNGTALTGVMAPSGAVTSLAIQDSDVAWASVQSDGIYMGTNRWRVWTKMIDGNFHLVRALPNIGLFYYVGGALRLRDTAGTTLRPSGILAGDTLISIENLNSTTLFAAGLEHVYESQDGGKSWSNILAHQTRSIYIDRTSGILYSGGDTVLRSTDTGLSWQTTPDHLNGGVASGEIFGAHDCSGVAYAYNRRNPILIRTEDFGHSFLPAGPPNSSQYDLEKGFTFERGSVLYWLDSKTGLVSVSNDGSDGSLIDSIASYVVASPSVSIVDSLCNSTVVGGSLAIHSLLCISAILDSIAPLGRGISLQSHIISKIFSSYDTAKISFTHVRSRVGLDSGTFHIYYHASESGLEEHATVTVSAITYGSPAVLGLSTDQLDFGATTVDSTKSLELQIHNSGCDTLRIDSLALSDSVHFRIQPANPLNRIPTGGTASIRLIFRPVAATKYLESLEIGTNAGHRFISLRGTGTLVHSSVQNASDLQGRYSLYPIPASERITLHSNRPVNGIHTAQLLNVLGEVERSITFNSTTNDREISLLGLPEGVYFLRIDGETHRIVVAY